MLTWLNRIMDRIQLGLSSGHEVEGLWVGAWDDKSHGDTQRVQYALDLIKNNDPLQYAYVTRHLKRIWVNLLTGNRAEYRRSIDACVFDERFVRSEMTTIAEIAAIIIHEATHARLEHLGIRYDEKQRSRIETICYRREIAFVSRLSHCEGLREKLVYELGWFIANPDNFSNQNFSKRHVEGSVEALRYLKIPNWLIRIILSFRNMTPETVRKD
jgi:hypothetical protein